MALELRLQPDAARLTLPRFLADVAELHADRCALRFADRDWSYRELEHEARRLARGLIGAGVVKGARVALLMGNRPEWAAAAFGVALAGGVLVPVNTFATPAERDYILRHGDASVLLMQRTLAGRDLVGELLASHDELRSGAAGRLRCAALPQLRRVFCLGGPPRPGPVESWDDLGALGGDVSDALLDAAAAEVHPADDAVIVYTSGTTAHPKAILHAQRAPVVQSYRFAEYMALSADDRVFTAQPFFWTAGFCMSLGATLAAGGLLVLHETFDVESALETVESERITALHAWAHQEKALAEHPAAAERDLTSLARLAVGSPLAPLAGVDRDEWSMRASYGLSETFTIASALPATAPAERRRDTSGLPLPGTEIRVVDPLTGAPVPETTEGEIAVRGATLMRGYYKVEPERFLDGAGFFRTQDGGWIDKEGYLHWTGRLSNLIKTGGANVSPLEIEAALARYPGIRAGVAVGVPHPTLGEVVIACVVPAQQGALDEDDARRFLRERLAAYKVPRRIFTFAEDEIAYTGNRKIQTEPLREAVLRRLAAGGVEIEGHRY